MKAAGNTCQIIPSLRLLSSAPDNHSSSSDRPVVVLFPWLCFTERAVQKYCDIYLERNIDVLLFCSTLTHFLLPSRGRAAVKAVLDVLVLHERTRHRKHILVHCFSGGGLMYTLFRMEMEANIDKYALLHSKIRAQIFDSITEGGDKVSRGAAEMVNNPIAQALLKTLIDLYLYLTKRYTVDVYEQAMQYFKYKPLNLPSLFLYSENDPLASCENIRGTISLWKEGGNNFVKGKIDVHEKCWEKSAHVGHLKLHTDEYLAAISDLLRHIQLGHTVFKSNL